MQSSTPGRTDEKNDPRFWRWFFGATILALLFGFVFFISVPAGNTSLAQDPRFVVTSLPRMGLRPNATILQRVFSWWLEVQQKFRGPRPMNYTFSASPTNRCSIHGLLNQCMEVTGVRYAIARDVAGGSVQFGHTNALTGVQWVRAFTEALQTGQPEWWDPKTKSFRRENLVLLTNDARTLLVVPKEMALELQREQAN